MYWNNPEDIYAQQCTWVQLMKRRYVRCIDYVMADGLCMKHHRLWRQLERQRALDENEGIDPWGEEEETRVVDKELDENPFLF